MRSQMRSRTFRKRNEPRVRPTCSLLPALLVRPPRARLFQSWRASFRAPCVLSLVWMTSGYSLTARSPGYTNFSTAFRFMRRERSLMCARGFVKCLIQAVAGPEERDQIGMNSGRPKARIAGIRRIPRYLKPKNEGFAASSAVRSSYFLSH